MSGPNNSGKNNQNGSPAPEDPLHTDRPTEDHTSRVELEEDANLALSDDSFTQEEEAPDTLKQARGASDDLAAVLPGGVEIDFSDDEDQEPEPKPEQKQEKEPDPSREPFEQISERFKTEEKLETTGDGDRAREKLAPVKEDLMKMLGQLPPAPGQAGEVDVAEFMRKVEGKDFGSMTTKELQLGVRLEAEVPGFAEKTGAGITRESFRLTNQFLNSAVIGAHDVLSQMKLSMGPGDPLGIARIGTDPGNAGKGIPHDPDTINNLIKDGKLDLTRFREMSRSGHLETSLILEPDGIPSRLDMDKMSNSFDWLYANQDRIATTTRRIDANNQYFLLKDVLGYDKPNYSPDKVKDGDLEAYNSRMTEVLNLLFRVRNYGEAMVSLDNVEGDFDNKQALEELKQLGDYQIDPERKNFRRLSLRLPDDLTATAGNERVLQGMRDWLQKHSAPVDQAMEEYLKGNFVRYGDVQQKGRVGVDSAGKVVYIKNEAGDLVTVTTPDGKVINASLDGSRYYDQDGVEVPAEKAKELAGRSVASEREFQYVNQEFDTRDDGKNVHIDNRRHYYQDHLLNYQNWFGIKQGDVSESRSYQFDRYVGVQTQSGTVQLVRADRMGEFKAIQAFFHHGSKIASAALDVGMIATGSIGARAALTAGKGLYVATNVGRVMLGVGGLMDPAFRQMGDTGEAIRKARHIAILADVTQGLGRQGLAKLSAGKLAFETPGATAVAKVIEESARMKRIETATRWAFGAADGVWLPLMSNEAHEKIKRGRGEDSFAYLHDALIQRGSGLGDTGDRNFSGPPDAAQASKTAFSVYRPLLGGGENTSIFDRTESALASGDANAAASLRGDLVALFHPTGASIQQWKKSHGNESAHIERIKPGELPVEKESDKTERIATAISLLYLAQKDGKLPDDGVLARRQTTVPGYSYYVSGGGEGAPPVEIKVPPESLEQTITTNDVIKILSDAALDSANPASQMAAADALFRTGSLPAGRYAGVLLDVVDNSAAGKDLKFKALRQISDLLVVEHAEENNPALGQVDRHRLLAASYGLDESNLKDRLANLAGSGGDKDIRAMAAAVLFTHERPDGDIADYQRLWDETVRPGREGAFHDAFVAEMKATLAKPLPVYEPVPVNPTRQELERYKELVDKFDQDLAAFDRGRTDKLDSARALGNLDGPQRTTYRADINRALMDTLSFPDRQWIKSDVRRGDQIPDMTTTALAFHQAMDNWSSLTPEQQSKLRDFGLEVMDRGYEDPARAAKSNYQAFILKAMVAENIPALFPGSTSIPAGPTRQHYHEQEIFMRDSLLHVLSDRAKMRDWGREGTMAVTAIKGLTHLGEGEEIGAGQPGSRPVGQVTETIAMRLATRNGEFIERDPFVRARALQAINILDPSLFTRSREELNMLGLPDINFQSLLKTESDPLAVKTLFAVADRACSYQNPEDFQTQQEYCQVVKDISDGALLDKKPEEIRDWLKNSPFKIIDQQVLAQQARLNARDYLWSGFGGWLDQTFTSKDTEYAREEYRANHVESYRLNWDREKQFKELANFHQMSRQDQDMTIKFLVHMVSDGDQQIIPQDKEREYRIKAARLLCEISQSNGPAGDRVKNKALLSTGVITALLDSSADLPAEAKRHLVRAVGYLTDRNYGADIDSGEKASDYSVITPRKAGEVLTRALEREARNIRRLGDSSGESTRLQIGILDAIHDIGYMGRYSVLAAMGPDPQLDPANPGTYLPQVRERARQVVESLWWGTERLSHDAGFGMRIQGSRPSPLTGSADSDATKIGAQLIGPQERNFEQVARDIFKSAASVPIDSASDPRVAVLVRALSHPNQRVELAAARALAGAGLDPGSEPVRAASRKLLEMALYGERQVYKAEAGRALLALEGTGDRRPASPDELLHGVGWLDRNDGDGRRADQSPPAATLAAGVEAALNPRDRSFDSEITASLITTRAEEVADSFVNGQMVPLTSASDPRRTRLAKALGSDSERVRFAAALVLSGSAIKADRDLAAGQMRQLSRTVESLASFNYKDAVRAIVDTARGGPIKDVFDPRREALTEALSHDNERVRLAAAWRLSESAINGDRQTAVAELAAIANGSGNAIGRQEAQALLKSIIDCGNLDDQLLAHNAWQTAYDASSAPGKVPPPAVPNEYSRSINRMLMEPRSHLTDFVDYTSTADKVNLLRTLTGWSQETLDYQLGAEYRLRIKPSERRQENTADLMRFSTINRCASHNPKHQYGYEESRSFRLTLGGQFAEDPLTEQQKASALDSILYRHIRGENIAGAGSLDSLLAFKDPATGRGSNLEPFVSGRSDQLLKDFLEQIKKDTPAATPIRSNTGTAPSPPASPPRWRPAAAFEGTSFLQIKDRNPGSLSRTEIESLYGGVGLLNRRAGARLTDTTDGDARKLATDLAGELPGNGRQWSEDLFASIKHSPIAGDNDPRLAVLDQALRSGSERVRLASSWMLSQSGREKDLEKAVGTLASLAVQSRNRTTSTEAAGLLKDMIYKGSDTTRDAALKAWKEIWEASGREPSRKPPEFNDADQARKYLERNPVAARSLYALPVDHRKAIFLAMSAAGDGRPFTEEELDARISPPTYTPVLNRQAELFQLRGNPFRRENPLDLFTNSFQLRPYPVADRSRTGAILLESMKQRYAATVPEARFSFDRDGKVVFDLESDKPGSEPLRITTTSSNRITFSESAPDELVGQFLKEMLDTRPDLGRRQSLDSRSLATMYKNWLSQRGRGLPTAIISDQYNDYGIDQLEMAGLGLHSDLSTDRWVDVSRRRESSLNNALNRELTAMITPRLLTREDYSPSWTPPPGSALSADIARPDFLSAPPVETLVRYRSNIVALLPEDLKEHQSEDGSIPLWYIQAFARDRAPANFEGNPNFRVLPGLSSKSNGQYLVIPRDDRTLRTMELDRTGQRLRVIQTFLDNK